MARFIFALAVLLILTALVFGAYKLAGFISETMNKEVEVTTVTVTKSGNIKQTIIEDFDKSLYDESALKKDIEDKAKASGGGVEVEDFVAEDGKVTVKLKYKSDDDMASFNDEVFYADTVDALIKEGVSFDSDAIKSGAKHAVIVSESMDIRCPQKIQYADGAMKIDDKDPKLAHCSVEDGQIAFVLY